MNIVLNLLRPLIGKNVQSLARAASTFIGTALVSVGALEAAQTADGVQVGELFQILGGISLIAISRLASWLRAKEGISSSVLAPIAETLGPIVGRSIHSLTRAALTAASAWLATTGLVKPGTDGAELGNMDLEHLLGAVFLFVLARVYSYIQDRGRKP